MSAPAVKILLVYPPSRTQSHRSCPMGMLMLAAVLEKAGHQVHLLDANAANRRLTTEQIVEIATAMRPDVIGITLVTPLIEGGVPTGFGFAAVRRQTDRRRTARHVAAGRTARERLRRRGGGRGRADHRRSRRGRTRSNDRWSRSKGLVYRGQDGRMQQNEPAPAGGRFGLAARSGATSGKPGRLWPTRQRRSSRPHFHLPGLSRPMCVLRRRRCSASGSAFARPTAWSTR